MKDQKEHIIKEYEKKEVVDTFDSQRSKYAYQRFKHNKESQVLKDAIRCCKEKKLRVLDVAVGTGRMIPTVLSSNKQIEYVGLDSSKTMLNSIKRRSNVKLIKGDATKLPFKDNTFDVVFTFHLLWHLPKDVQVKIVNEMKRVCKKDGFIVLDIINNDFIFGKNTDGIYKWNNVSRFKTSDTVMYKLNDFPVKNSFVYGILNIINCMENFLPVNLFHMVYLIIRK